MTIQTKMVRMKKAKCHSKKVLTPNKPKKNKGVVKKPESSKHCLQSSFMSLSTLKTPGSAEKWPSF